MGSRSPLFIMIIGICGLAAFGMATKVALDGSDQLKGIVKFKTGVLSVFESRGLEEVSYRLQRNPRMGRVLLTVDSSLTKVDEQLEHDLVAYYLKVFPKATGDLKLEFSDPGGWGVGTPDPYRVGEYSLREFRRLLKERDAIAGLKAAAAEIYPGAEVLDVRRGPRTLTVRLLTPEPAPLRELAAACARRLSMERRTKLFMERAERATEKVVDDNTPKATSEPRVVETGWFDYRGRPTSPPRGAR